MYRNVIAMAGGREIQSLAQPLRKPPPDPLPDSTRGPAHGPLHESLNRGGVAAAMYASPPYDVAVPAMAVSRLSINLTDSAVSGHLDGDRPRRYEARRHSLFFTPAGASANWQKERPSRHINLYFDADALSGTEGLRIPSGPLLNGMLPSARVLIEMLGAELAQADAFAAEAVDSLARLIVLQFARRQLAAGDEGLAAPLRARVDEFIAANVERRLLVSELAAVAGMPPARFAQAFVRSVGKAPHQYVLEQRVRHAGELLRRTEQPLADIAASCGFSSQQHMTRLLRQRLGQTPGQVRSGLRGASVSVAASFVS